MKLKVTGYLKSGKIVYKRQARLVLFLLEVQCTVCTTQFTYQLILNAMAQKGHWYSL